MFKSIGLWVSLVAFVACSGPASRQRLQGKELLKAVHARIDTLNAIYDTCFRVRDNVFFTEWYMPDACTMPEGMQRICGRNAIAEYRWGRGEARVFRLTLHAEDVSGDGEQIVEQGNYLVSSTMGAALDKGKTLLTWRRDTDGKWKIYREIWNSDIPHEAPPDTLSAVEG